MLRPRFELGSLDSESRVLAIMPRLPVDVWSEENISNSEHLGRGMASRFLLFLQNTTNWPICARSGQCNLKLNGNAEVLVDIDFSIFVSFSLKCIYNGFCTIKMAKNRLKNDRIFFLHFFLQSTNFDKFN